ncbi:hypothetical protein ANANG_G00275090, partial [Anguilla anguilla]
MCHKRTRAHCSTTEIRSGDGAACRRGSLQRGRGTRGAVGVVVYPVPLLPVLPGEQRAVGLQDQEVGGELLCLPGRVQALHGDAPAGPLAAHQAPPVPVLLRDPHGLLPAARAPRELVGVVVAHYAPLVVLHALHLLHKATHLYGQLGSSGPLGRGLL